jgi:hypothetical protein
VSHYLQRLVRQAAGRTEPGQSLPAPHPVMPWTGVVGRANPGMFAQAPQWGVPGGEAWPSGTTLAREAPGWPDSGQEPPGEAPPVLPAAGWQPPAGPAPPDAETGAGAAPALEVASTPPDAPTLPAAHRPADPGPPLAQPPAAPARRPGPPPGQRPGPPPGQQPAAPAPGHPLGRAVAPLPPVTVRLSPDPLPATPTWSPTQPPGGGAAEPPALAAVTQDDRAAAPAQAVRDPDSPAPAIHHRPQVRPAASPDRAVAATSAAGQASAPTPVPATPGDAPTPSLTRRPATVTPGPASTSGLGPATPPAPAARLSPTTTDGPRVAAPPDPPRAAVPDQASSALPDPRRAAGLRQAGHPADSPAPAALGPAPPSRQPRAGATPPTTAFAPAPGSDEGDRLVPAPAASPVPVFAVPARQLRTDPPAHAAWPSPATVPAIQVRIGRVEVQAPPAPPAPQAPPPAPQRSGLAELEVTRRHLDRISY